MVQAEGRGRRHATVRSVAVGKRSRKRGTGAVTDSPQRDSSRAERDEARRRRAEVVARGEDAPPRRRGRRPRSDERPPPPWGKFPLTELTVLIAIVMGVIGLLSGGARGRIMLVGAMVLGSLGGLELSIREHFAGFRSHSSLLAGAAAIGTVALTFVIAGTLPAWVPLAVGVLIFGLAFWGLREAFKRRSGGLGFR